MRGLLSGGGDSVTCANYERRYASIVSIYISFRHTDDMDQSSAAAEAAGGLHLTKDPVSISNPDIK